MFTKDGITLTNYKNEETESIPVKINWFANSETLFARENNLDESQFFYKRRYHFDLSIVELHSISSRCYDTGVNLVTFYTKSGNLKFTNTENVIMFEKDIDKNYKPEIYLIDFSSCMNRIRIFKIYR